MTTEDKLKAIQGRRESIEHARYGAELDLAVAEQSRNDDATVEPKARLEEADAQLKALDEAEAKVKAEGKSTE